MNMYKLVIKSSASGGVVTPISVDEKPNGMAVCVIKGNEYYYDLDFRGEANVSVRKWISAQSDKPDLEHDDITGMRPRSFVAKKGNSTIYVDIHTCNHIGRKVNAGDPASYYSVYLGGHHGISDHGRKDAAERELFARIGQLVYDGYTVEEIKEAGL